jgi:radical SAM superfamily enzyme YgiQ (UPF0313 family)
LSRVDLLTRPGEVEALRRAGCQIVWVVAESGTQKILDAMEKGNRVDQIVQTAKQLHAAGIQVGFFLQFGYPGEELADIAMTLDLVRECQPDDIGMSVSYPLPGTGFYEAVKAQLGQRQNWFDSNDLAMLYQGPFTTDFYRQLHVTLHREFRMRKAMLELVKRLKQHPGSIDRPLSLRKNSLQLAAEASYHAALLPLERRRLSQLAKIAHRGIEPISPRMSPEAASYPSTQPD